MVRHWALMPQNGQTSFNTNLVSTKIVVVSDNNFKSSVINKYWQGQIEMYLPKKILIYSRKEKIYPRREGVNIRIPYLYTEKNRY